MRHFRDRSWRNSTDLEVWQNGLLREHDILVEKFGAFADTIDRIESIVGRILWIVIGAFAAAGSTFVINLLERSGH